MLVSELAAETEVEEVAARAVELEQIVDGAAWLVAACEALHLRHRIYSCIFYRGDLARGRVGAASRHVDGQCLDRSENGPEKPHCPVEGPADVGAMGSKHAVALASLVWSKCFSLPASRTMKDLF